MISSNLISILLISFLNYHVIAGLDLSCKDEHGNSVDYWMAYSPPQSSNTGYLYYLNGQSENSWHNSNKSIFDKESVIGKTFSDIYEYFEDLKSNGKFSEHIRYMQHSSDIKIKRLNRFTDSKGAIVWDSDKKKAIWLSHSIPRLDSNGVEFMPKFENEYKYDYRTNEAQMALCLQIDYSNFHIILRNLIAIGIQKEYRNYDNEEFLDIIKLKPFELRTDLKTAANKKFSIHTKLYEKNGEHEWASKWITNGDLKSQHIQDKSKNEENCNQRNVGDILELEASLNGNKIKWNYENDKSKWTLDATNDKLCFSDFGREDFDFKSFFGHVICLHDYKLHGLLNSLIKTRTCKRQSTTTSSP